MTTDNNQIKKWVLPKPLNIDEIDDCSINYTLQKVLCRRGLNLEEDLHDFLTPSNLPNPEDHFIELNKATQRIVDACNKNEKIAICGDYDADGITSTVLLVELLTKLGAKAIPYIPSRKEDGYGLNIKMINDINIKEIKLIITVDNGISAFDAIRRSKEFNIDLIITDHHKIPDNNLSIYALIHPEKSPKDSPYKFLAGVGIAYMLAKNICDKLQYNINQCSAKELFCIGTVADMAPLLGANRKWLKECLPKLNSTDNIGLKTVIKKLSIYNRDISTDDIGYKIAPVINAVGRLGDPKIVFDLLTSKSESSIISLTKECLSLNKERKRITENVEQEAMQIAFTEYANNRKFIIISKEEWHPGIIGIVAARIVDKFNLPTAVLSSCKDGIYRGSIRSNKNLKVNIALDECKELLIAHGGHSAAAGFTIKEENIPYLRDMLNIIATREFENCDLNKIIKPDACIKLKDINLDFYRQLMLLGPFGMMNQAPIFWARKCTILSIFKLKGNHIKILLKDDTGFIDAIKWNYSEELRTYDVIDIAFNIEINTWKKEEKIQLNIIEIKKYEKVIDLMIHKRKYKCQLTDDMKVKVTNSKGQYLTSDLLFNSENKNIKQETFAKKILAFAEIALGETA